MNSEQKRVDWQNKDATLPLLLAGLVSSILCVCMCVAISSSGDFINNELAPRLGLIEPTPTPVPCPAIPTGWVGQRVDEFVANASRWPVGNRSNEYADTNLEIVDGVLRFSIDAHQRVISHREPDNVMIYRDFYLKSNTRRASGPLNTNYGLVYRHTDSNYYMFSINDEQRFLIRQRSEDDALNQVFYNLESQSIRPGEFNELVILGEGSHFKFCINQTLVAEVDDEDYTGGELAIGTSLSEANVTAVVEYDDFKVYMPRVGSK